MHDCSKKNPVALLDKISETIVTKDAAIVTLIDNSEPEAIDAVMIMIPRATYDAMVAELKNYQ